MNRKHPIKTGEYYHVFNRGVEKRRIFYQKSDYVRFLKNLKIFNTVKPSWTLKDMPEEKWLSEIKKDERLVDIIAYCINPNHFHLLLMEIKKDGLSLFMKKISTGYAMYFNKKNERSGTLFQGRYKSTHINNNES